MMTKLKHITVNEEVYQKLKNLGRAGDSFNDVLIRILSAPAATEQDREKGWLNNKRNDRYRL